MSSTSCTITYTSVDTDFEPGRAFWPADEELSDGGSPRVIEDQPLPIDASPVALSLGFLVDSDPKEDPEEDPEEDHADYPADGGDDDDEPSDNDDDDDDTDDEDEDDDEEEEEHLAPADSPAIPIVDPIPSARDTEAFETDKVAPTPVERLLTLPPPPAPLISLSPPSAEERLARCLAAPALSSSPLPIVPHPYGSPNHVRAPPGFRTAMDLPPQVPTSLPLPSSPLQPLPCSLFIPPSIDRREDIHEAELPPRKRLCLTALTSRYEVRESSTAAPRPTGGHRVDYGLIGTMDDEIRRQRAKEVGYGIMDVWLGPTKAVEEVAPTTLEGVNV
ncbi:hypothetical protein Tco_1491319 [Tanacetum coccineum]